MRYKDDVDLLLFLSGHRIEGRDTASLDYIGTKTHTHEVQILYDLVAAVNALDHDAGAGLPKEERAMKTKPKVSRNVFMIAETWYEYFG